MSDTGADLSLLQENLRLKVIYYSCINPNTISDLNEAWGYSSPTYLYQGSSLEKLQDANLIEVRRGSEKNTITSNYNALFSKENLERSLSKINKEILEEFLINSKGFQPGTNHDSDKDVLLDMARDNLDMDLEEQLMEIEFDEEEFKKLVEFWTNDTFKEAFLSLGCISRLFKDRKQRIPDNPVIFLFRLTMGVASSLGRVRDERMDIPDDLKYRFEKIIVPVYRTLKKKSPDGSSPELKEFKKELNDTFSLFRTKFKEDRYDFSFIERFSDITIHDEEERKVGSLFKKLKGDGR